MVTALIDRLIPLDGQPYAHAVLALAASHLLDAVNAYYERQSRYGHERPIKGYVQMAKIVVAAAVAVATLIERRAARRPAKRAGAQGPDRS
jgi:hypothetical protein